MLHSFSAFVLACSHNSNTYLKIFLLQFGNIANSKIRFQKFFLPVEIFKYKNTPLHTCANKKYHTFSHTPLTSSFTHFNILTKYDFLHFYNFTSPFEMPTTKESQFMSEMLDIDVLLQEDVISIIYGYLEPLAIIDDKKYFESDDVKEILSTAKTAFFYNEFKIPNGTKMPKMEKIGGHACLPFNCDKMFKYSRIQNCDLSNFNTSSVTDMSYMFCVAKSFNSDISNWDVSSVTDMRGVFSGAKSFNSDISKWDVSLVTDMRSVFSGAKSFNSDISNWNVSSVTDMRWMFYGAKSFNSDISKWDVSSVTDMSCMFYDAKSFNSDISHWNVSLVTDMCYMFYGTESFNSDIGNWDVSSVTNMTGMFYNTTSFSLQTNALWYSQ